MNPSSLQRLMWVLWPAFLMACIAEIAVFSLVDPNELHVFGTPVTVDRMTVYAIAFFAFWALCSASGALTVLLQRSPYEVNRCPLDGPQRPEGCPKRMADPAAGDAPVVHRATGHGAA